MHSSFPRKDERHFYRPANRASIRHYMNRIWGTCQSNHRVLGIVVVALILLIMVFWGRTTKETTHHPPVVLVAVLEDTDGAGEEVKILDKILENRWEYANAHGMNVYSLQLTLDYELAIFNASDFTQYTEAERSWVKLSALRDAMTLHPHSEWFWYLDQVSCLPVLSLTKVRNYNEPLNPRSYTLSLPGKPPSPPITRSPCLPPRNDHPHTLPPRSTRIPNKPHLNSRRGTLTHRIYSHSARRLRQFPAG